MYGGNYANDARTFTTTAYGGYDYPRITITIYAGSGTTSTGLTVRGDYYSPPTYSALEIEAFARELRYWSEGQARRNAIAPIHPVALRSADVPVTHPGMVHRMRCPRRSPRRTYREAA